jgi:hypothetical protein
VARNIFSIVPHGVRLEASFSLREDVISWRQSNPTGKTIHEKVIARKCAQTNDSSWASGNPVSDKTNTENSSETVEDVEERTSARNAKVHKILEMWQGSQNLHAIAKKSCAQNKLMTAIRYILDAAEVVRAS